jgi:PAS domain S-box-containing protein
VNVLSLLTLSAGAACLLLGAFVFFLDRKAIMNKIFMLVTTFAAYWAFTEVLMWEASDAAKAYFWNKISFLWPFFPVLAVHFALVFTDSKFGKKKLTLVALYFSALMFSLIELTTNEISGFPIKEYWGYVYTSPNTVLCYLCSIWSAGLALMALWEFVRYYFRITEETKKLQSRYFVFGFSVPVIAFVLTNIVFPLASINFPDIGITSTVALSGFAAYAIWKYGLFSLNPALAAEYIFSAIPDSLVLANMNWKITRANSSFARLLGAEEKDVVGKSLVDLLGDSDSVGGGFFSLLIEKRAVTGFEMTFKTKSCEEKTLLCSGSIVKGKSDKDIGIVCILHDITEKEKMEARLLKSERLAGIGELANMIAHDLRNPLQGIAGSVFYLKNRAQQLGDEKMIIALNRAEQSVSYADKIINGLLNYSRNINLELTVTNPRELVNYAILGLAIPAFVKLVDRTEEDPVFEADIEKMKQVILNLVANAFEAMPEGGTLTIISKASTGLVELSFGDTGAGIAKEKMGKLWTPFVTTKPKGMGLGLPICKRIVEAHGGNIVVETGSGKGTTFTLSLPLRSAKKAAVLFSIDEKDPLSVSRQVHQSR